MKGIRVVKATHGKFFLEICSGSAGLSKALRRFGISSKQFDTKNGPSGDLLKLEVLQYIRRLIQSGQCLGVWFALPCGTLSRARRNSGVMAQGLYVAILVPRCGVLAIGLAKILPESKPLIVSCVGCAGSVTFA